MINLKAVWQLAGIPIMIGAEVDGEVGEERG
jgi:hypothetical protein